MSSDKHLVVIVKTSDVTGWPQRRIDKLVDGIEINLNHDEFHVEERPADERDSQGGAS